MWFANETEEAKNLSKCVKTIGNQTSSKLAGKR